MTHRHQAGAHTYPDTARHSPGTRGQSNQSILVNGDGQVVAGPAPGFATTGGLQGASSGGAGSGTTSTATTGASSSPFVINISYDSSVASAPAAFTTAVQTAVQYLESQFTDPVTINIAVGYGEVAGYTLGSGALGSSMTYLSNYGYSQITGALAADAKTATDNSTVASLPSGSPVNGTYWVATSEAKALGLSGPSTAIDGYVGFSSSYAFTYDNTNGVAAGTYDFFGVAVHELSEVMGRMMFTGGSIGSTSNSYSPLDLLHYSASGVRDFSASTPGYFSVDGGKTSLGGFNTNSGGDAGDWGSGMGNDAFNAFSYSGVLNTVSNADLTTLDAIGWDRAGTAAAPAVTVTLASDTGASSTDTITANATLTGTAAANTTVTIQEGSVTLGTTTANATGAWSFTPAALSQGSHTITASETVSGATVSTSLSFTYDTVAPAVTLALTQDTGTPGDGITSNPALQGTGDANAVVTIRNGSSVLGTTTANASGAWNFTPTGLAQGPVTLTANETDAAGNTGTANLNFTYDTVAPVVTVTLAQDTGTPGDGVTSNPSVQGTGVANAVVTIRSGNTVLGTASANSTGAWSFTPAGLAQGGVTLTASETDGAGNVGTASVSFTYDTVAPAVSMSLTQDTGTPGDGVTSNASLQGTGAANTVVTIRNGSTVLGTTTANANGAWSFTPTGLAQGAVTLTASETDAAGNIGTASLSFTYDTVAPAVGIGLAQDTGTPGDGITSNPVLQGTGDANAVVTIRNGSTVLGSTTANTSGAWSFTPTGLAQGPVTLTANETDAAGNTGSASLSFTYDTVAPAVSIGLTQDTGTPGDGVTSNPALQGTGDANAVVTIRNGSTVLGTTTANAAGAWSFIPNGLTQGNVTLTASETDGAGNTGSANLNFVYAPLSIGTAITAATYTSAAQANNGLAGSMPIATIGQIGGPMGDNYSYSLSGTGASAFALAGTGDTAVLSTGSAGVAGGTNGKAYVLGVTTTDTSAGVSSGAAPLDVVVGSISGDTVKVAGLVGTASTPTFIYGGAGNDTLDGSGMLSSLWFAGGAGADRMTGGSGANTYQYGSTNDSTAKQMDVITNFNTATDLINLAGLGTALAYVGPISVGRLAAGSVGWQVSNGNTFIYVNTSGSTEKLASANMKIELLGSIPLTGSNFATG